ncbi:MAG TPA: helix-turn-helix transcriptional regulator [Solirubrobacterales bacterium]
MTALAFRNVDASPDDPVSEWPQEAIQAALERGGISHWRRLAKEIQTAPWGPVTRHVEEVLSYSRPYGVANAIERVIGMAREETEKLERETVAAEIDGLVRESGLSRTEFASRIGTSASRLSTYVTGRVTPSAALLVRMRELAQREHAGRELLAMSPPPGDGPEPDWEDQKRELLDAPMRKWPGA